MNIAILKTKLIENDPQFYIDVIEVDGAVYTQLLKKEAEPNIFVVALQQDGDTSDNIFDDYSSEKIQESEVVQIQDVG